MASLEDLKRLGWYLTPEGMQECIEDGKNSVDAITKVALDIDLKDIGAKRLPDSATKNKNDQVDGPLVLQIQKLRNVSAPKENQESQGAPPLLRLTLTDGHASVIALEMEKINKLTLGTPPGTKIRLTGTVQVSTGFLMLNKRNCEVLGGRVEKLVENWQLKRQLANQTRFNVDSGGSGPPPFIPFGQRNRPDRSLQGSKKDNFKSLDQNKDKEKEVTKKEEDKEFEEQRKATIKAAMETKAEGSSKYFGSGSSLKPNDRDVARIVEMGFSTDQVVAALKQNNNNIQNAISALLRDREANDPSDRDRRAPRSRQTDRPERSERESEQSYDKDSERVPERIERGDRGRPGRRGREVDDEEDYRSRPSAPATLFDVIAKKMDLPQGSEKEENREKPPKELSKSFSTESNEKRTSAGPPNLPPRLVKQQRAREEERIRRLSGGRPSSPGATNQRPPPPPPYAVQSVARPQRPPMTQGRYQDQGPRGPSPGLRQSYQPRPNYPTRHNRMEYPPKRVYDPHSRGQVRPNKMLWNDGDSARRPYRDNRNYNDRYVDRDYAQGPTNQRRGPNPRYQHGYQTYQNRQLRDSPNQYSTQGQYSGPPPHYGNKYNSDGPSRSYKQNRHQQQQSEPQPAEEQIEAADPVSAQESSGEQDSGGTQESGSSASDIAVEEQVQPQQMPMTESNQVDDGYITSEVVDEGQYARNEIQVIQYGDDPAMISAEQGGTTYVYTDGSDMSGQGGYVQVAPPAIVQHMQAMSLQNAAVPAAMQPYPTYQPGVMMDQSQMYAPTYNPAVPSLEYTNSNIAEVSTASTVVNGNKQKNTSDSSKQNARQWKTGDYCMAKYWEDQKFYRAIVNNMDPSGTMCLVTFPDYGNTEQVVISDIRPVPKQAWETNTIQSPPTMPVAGMVAGSQPTILMAPPGIPIQNPPALSFISTPFPQPEQSFQGSVVSLTPGTFTYTPVGTTMATAQYNTKQPVQQHIYVQQPQMTSHQAPMMASQPQMTSQVQMMASQPQMIASQPVAKK